MWLVTWGLDPAKRGTAQVPTRTNAEQLRSALVKSSWLNVKITPLTGDAS